MAPKKKVPTPNNPTTITVDLEYHSGDRVRIKDSAALEWMRGLVGEVGGFFYRGDASGEWLYYDVNFEPGQFPHMPMSYVQPKDLERA